jgi:uncharacterized protein
MNVHTPRPTMDLTLEVADVAAMIDEMSLEDILDGMSSPGYPGRLGSYQYTFSGGLFFPCDPRPEEVFIEDIATGLSRIARFNGQTREMMTDAEHSWLVSHQVPRGEALEGLMHDSPEGLIGDQIRPLKRVPIFGAIYLKIEDGIEQAIAARYGLKTPFLSPAIIKADEFVCGAEVAQNITNQVNPNHLIDDVAAAAAGGTSGLKLHYWPPEYAKNMFLDRFYELAAERGVRP